MPWDLLKILRALLRKMVPSQLFKHGPRCRDIKVDTTWLSVLSVH